MPPPSNITYQVGSTVYIVEPSVLDVLNAVSAKCVSAGRSDLLPINLCNLEDVLRSLGASLPADKTLVVGSTTFVTKVDYEALLAAARSIGA